MHATQTVGISKGQRKICPETYALSAESPITAESEIETQDGNREHEDAIDLKGENGSGYGDNYHGINVYFPD
jgi:hypothetical protein